MAETANLKTAESEKNSHLDYFHFANSVDCVIFCYQERKLKVLVIKSDLEEFSGLESLLGDFIRPDEELDQAAYRILLMRTGLEDVYLEQVKSFGGLSRHPSGRVITTAYYSLIDVSHHDLRINDNDLHWQLVNEINMLAFDHKQILDGCLARLREQVMEQPIIFNLLPEKFSLRDLQTLYEEILGVELDRRNFRKKISIKDWLIDLDEMEQEVPHRPGKLYKLNPQFQREILSK